MQTALAQNWVLSEPQTVTVTDRLDSGTVTEFLENIQMSMSQGMRELVLDCANLTYLSSAGLHAFLTIARDMQKIHGKLALCNLQGQALDILTTCGFDRIIRVYADQSEALAKIAA